MYDKIKVLIHALKLSTVWSGESVVSREWEAVVGGCPSFFLLGQQPGQESKAGQRRAEQTSIPTKK